MGQKRQVLHSVEHAVVDVTRPALVLANYLVYATSTGEATSQVRDYLASPPDRVLADETGPETLAELLGIPDGGHMVARAVGIPKPEHIDGPDVRLMQAPAFGVL